MLELARRESLGVHVGELLELQGALEGHGVADMTANEEHRGRIDELARERLNPLTGVEGEIDGLGHVAEIGEHAPDLVTEHVAAHLREVEAHQIGRDDLGEEGLGRGDGDLGPGVGVEHRIALARDRRADGVADGQGLRSLLPCVAQGHQRVHRLAGLGDGDGERATVDDRIAVAELAGQFDIDRDARPVLDGVLRDQSRVVRRTAGHDDDLVDLSEFGVGEPHLIEVEAPVARDTAAQGIRHRLGLLSDLLEHEEVVAALLGGCRIPGDGEGLRLDGIAVEVGDDDRVT